MKPGRASRTAELVCMARALGHGRAHVAGFDDPTAMLMLPEDARRRVERKRAGERPRGVRETMEWTLLDKRRDMVEVRTVAIDQAVRDAAPTQVVILGAGLDGRAWRMSELATADVFEVDHPDSQRDKRARAAALQPLARSLHFVPVDFTRDDLDRALAAADHDATIPTTWIWEGVVMYLTADDIHATLRIVARRSAATSTLLTLYMAPSHMTPIVGLVLRSVGEPLRSLHTADQMRTLLAAHDFAVARDADLPTLGAAISADAAARTRHMQHLRLAVARKS